MSAVFAEHPIQWVTAAPLWSDAVRGGLRDATAAEEVRMQRPALLRFASDSFMDDLAALLADEPARLKDQEARPVTFRARPPGAPSWPPPQTRLKLFQAAHGDFNLVAAALVCRRPGLPDHLVRPEVREQTGFVLRRVGETGELAWTGREWRAVPAAAAGALAAGEDVLPLFPLNYREGERTRRLFVGLVPASSRESYKGAAAGAGASLAPAPADAATLRDARLESLDLKVIEPLKALKRPPQRPDDISDTEWTARRSALAAGKVDASRFLLLDFGEWLETHLPQTWQRVAAGQAPPPGTPLLHQRLRESQADYGTTWAEALRAAWQQRERILGLADAAPTVAVNLEHSTPDPKELRGWIALALPTAATGSREAGRTPSTPGPEHANVPKLDPKAAALYRIRCVYARPECGPLHDDVISAPTEDFQLASFFDADAPARPIHIALPIDPNDLRGSAKNVSVLLSDAMRQQVSRAADLASLMKGSLGSGESFNVGLVCSFSIPIITICALILLMIIVSLLNIVFWWLPFFRICFPVGLKAGRA